MVVDCKRRSCACVCVYLRIFVCVCVFVYVYVGRSEGDDFYENAFILANLRQIVGKNIFFLFSPTFSLQQSACKLFFITWFDHAIVFSLLFLQLHPTPSPLFEIKRLVSKSLRFAYCVQL